MQHTSTGTSVVGQASIKALCLPRSPYAKPEPVALATNRRALCQNKNTTAITLADTPAPVLCQPGAVAGFAANFCLIR